MCIHYSTRNLLASYKVRMFLFFCCIRVILQVYSLIFVGIKFSWILLHFLSMIINDEVLHIYCTWCLRYNNYLLCLIFRYQNIDLFIQFGLGCSRILCHGKEIPKSLLFSHKHYTGTFTLDYNLMHYKWNNIYAQLHTVHTVHTYHKSKTFKGENFYSFHGFVLNWKFSMNYGFVDQ